MSSNPEFPKPENQLVKYPHAGGEEVPDDVREVPQREFNETPLLDAAKEELFVIPNTYEEGFQHSPFSEEERARINRTPEKKSKSRALVAGIAGLALAAGVAIGLNAGAKEDNTPPTPTETSAAANPNVTQQPEISTTPQPTAEVVTGVAPEDLKFYNADGTFQTRKEVIDNVKVSPVEYKTVNDTFDAIFGRIEAAINYIPDEKTVRNNLNIPTEPLTIENYQKVAEDFQAITFDTVLRGDGKLRTTFENIGRDTAYARLLTWGDKEPVLYGIHITQDLIKSQKINITDNSTLNSIDDNASRNIGEYRIKSTSVNDLAVPLVPENEDPNTYKPTWQLAGSIDTVKVG